MRDQPNSNAVENTNDRQKGGQTLTFEDLTTIVRSTIKVQLSQDSHCEAAGEYSS
jgi:hypothetical protein